MRFWSRPVFLLFVFAALGVVAAGCRTGSDDMSERPWNTPKSWESGLPSALTEGR